MKRLFRPIQNLNFLARVSVKSQIKKRPLFLHIEKNKLLKKELRSWPHLVFRTRK